MRELTTDDNLEVTGEGACIMSTGAGGFAVARVGGLAAGPLPVCASEVESTLHSTPAGVFAYSCAEFWSHKLLECTGTTRKDHEASWYRQEDVRHLHVLLGRGRGIFRPPDLASSVRWCGCARYRQIC